jgi:hypothetical protein
MKRYYSCFPVLFCILLAFMQKAKAQEKAKNYVGVSVDGIHTWTKSYNIHQKAFGSTYDISPGITVMYDRIIKDRFFVRAKVGYYYLVNNTDFPGEFPFVDHSMKRIGQNHADAFPLGVNLGVVHNINTKWSLNFYLGLSSYLLYRAIPSGYTTNLDEFFRANEEASITTRIISGSELTSYDFIHSFELGHAVIYNISQKYPLSIIMNNYLKAGFRPYRNFDMVVFTSGLEGEAALWNITNASLSNLFFSSIGIRYGF